MKNLLCRGRIRLLLCLSILISVLVLNPTYVQASNEGIGSNSDSILTGELEDENENKTNINDPGTAQTGEDLAEMNISNNLTITYSSEKGNGEINGALRILMILTAMSIAPLLLVMLTSFTRILIVMHFTRAAVGTQTAPPNNILIAISLFLTFFIMSPTFTQIYNEAIIPFEAGDIEMEEAFTLGMAPLREFMYEQTQVKDVDTFMQIKGEEWDGTCETIPTSVLIPSFIVSELRTAFIIGFLIYIPFIVIDMVVASTLMSMGMMMLPPTTISMPFKILLFVLADGWNLIIMNVVKTFY